MTVRLTRAAERDVAQAVAYFEAQREGLGGLFVERVNEAIRKIEKTPLAYACIIKDVRRVLTRQFRYHIWYRVLPDEAL